MAYEYTVNGQNISLSVVKDMLGIRFREPAPLSIRNAAVSGPEFENFEDRFEVPKEKYTVFNMAKSLKSPSEHIAEAVIAMDAHEEIERSSPVFKVGTNYAMATDRLNVGFKTNTAAAKILKEYGCQILAQTGNEFSVSVGANVDPFDVVAKLGALSQVSYAEPDFVTFGSHVAARSEMQGPADPMEHNQYAIDITLATAAWQLQTGDPAIKIAILDEGVDTAHEDLAAAVVGNYDGVDDDSFQEPKPWDAHGTACAGLAVAIPENQIGIKGIGGGCSLMAVRIAYSPTPGGKWVARNSWITRAIEWSWTNGADILSNSWGGGAPSSAITNAFARARTLGRAGKGCVIVIAAGNTDSLHDYPGNLDEVLTISASNEFDEPKTKTSQDGESWWGSSYGPKIDVAAPGVHNFTTDISGDRGYNKTAGLQGNYYDRFNGTSSSTPIVAGAVGLVLSANSALSEAESRNIIRDTADKVGPLPYPNGRNDRMGHGRLNVLEAVKAAQATRTAALSE